MHLLVASIASHGHTYPLLPFALAARKAGHDVSYATGDDLLPLVERLGFRPVAAGGSMREAFAGARTSSGRDMSQRFEMSEQETMEIVGQVFGDIVPRRTAADLEPELSRLRPDVVVHEMGNSGAGLAARAAGVPGIRHGFGRSMGGAMPQASRDHLLAVATDLGVDPDAIAGPGLGDPYLDICPESLQNPDFLAEFDGSGDRAARRVPLRPVPFAEPGDLPAWATGPGPPLVYLTLGTAFAQAPLLRTAIDGLSRLPVRVLVAAGPMLDGSTLGELRVHGAAASPLHRRGSVRVEQWVPQADLLPHAALVVHHGGSGTTLGALAHGVRQLFLPQGADQFANAEAVTRAGAGTQVPPHELSGDAVAEAASALLADTAAASAAAGFATEIAAMPSPPRRGRAAAGPGRSVTRAA